MGLTFNNNRQRIIKGNQVKNYSFLSTGRPTYWPTDENKLQDLLDFFVANGISSNVTNYDVSLNQSPITATLSTSLIGRKPTPH